MFFKDRQDAGRQLCQLLKEYKDTPSVVYALPRGGVAVAAEISRFLHAPLDLIFAHKIGHPYQPEFAVAAISESGHMIGPSQVLSLESEWLEREKEEQIREIKRKRAIYLKSQKEISVENKIAILVDDGIATGLTMQVAIDELKDRHPKKIVVAVPVAPRSTANLIKALVDDFVGFIIDDYNFRGAVGAYYEEFNQVEDDEVVEILNPVHKPLKAKIMERFVQIRDQGIHLEGILKIPQFAQGIVLFAHGSGSSRLSPRNNFVADILNDAGLATLLMDLLSKHEDEVYQTRFDIDLLTERLNIAIQWLKGQPATQNLSLGIFGSSTGAAAALRAASGFNKGIKAVVSRGGRPDLAMDIIDSVAAPTLFIVGENDFNVLELNQAAYARLTCTKELKIVPNAAHLFEEPGCLEEVARLAKEWFQKHLKHEK